MNEQAAENHAECGQPWTDHDDDGVQMLCPDVAVTGERNPCGHAE